MSKIYILFSNQLFYHFNMIHCHLKAHTFAVFAAIVGRIVCHHQRKEFSSAFEAFSRPLMTSFSALFRHRGRLWPVRFSASHPSVPSASKRKEARRGEIRRRAGRETAQLIRLFIQMRRGSQSITSLPVSLFKVWAGASWACGKICRPICVFLPHIDSHAVL